MKTQSFNWNEKKMIREMKDIYRKVSSIFYLIHEVNYVCH